MMRRLLVVACLAFSLAAQALADGKPLRVGSEVDFPPFADVDAEGRATGFAVELMRAVAKEAGIDVEFVPGPWDTVWRGLVGGEYHALPLVARMPEREVLVELTRPHTIGYDSFFVRKGEPKIETIEQARARSIIVVRSDAGHHELLGRGFDRQLFIVDSLADGMRLLASGHHDALLAPLLQGRMVLRKTELLGAVESGPLLSEYRREFCFAVRKGDMATRDRLDRALAHVKQSGRYDELYREWLEIHEPAMFPVRYAVAGVAGITLVLAVLALWTTTLRRLVKLRTAELVQANSVVRAERQRLFELNAELEQRVAERTAQAVASEARFRAMADSAPAYIWLAGPDKRCTWVNEQWLAFRGRSLEQELGDGWLEGVHPEDLDHCRQVYTQAFDSRLGFEMEYRLRRADGEYRWLLDRGLPHVGPDGEFLGYVGSCVDMTERLRVENDLQAAKAEAERANDAKSRFLAAASHDLRQPLSALALYVGVLAGRVGPGEADLVANMRACVGSLSEMLSDLLDLSKLEAGVVKPNVVDFAVDEMLGRIASAYAPKAAAKGIFLRCAPWRLAARTDPVLFHRMVGNLVANAVRYTESGGVLVGCRRRDGKVWIEVWDTGIGIPDDKTATVFEEFTQLRTGAEHDKGSGLGLTIVAKTAALLGLQLRVASRVGRGSLFALELPPGRDIAARVPSPQPQRRLRIGLVDDSPTVRHALDFALRDAGHEVVSAATRRELLAALGGCAPDIVISDYRLTGRKTGFEVISAVREAFGTEIPALIITGDTAPKVLRRMTGKGVRVQHKPIDLDLLNANVAELTAATAAEPRAKAGQTAALFDC